MTSARALVERRERDACWVYDPALEAALDAMGWPDPETLMSGLAGATSEPLPGGSAGRAPTRVLELPGHPERAHLRRVQHGGVAGPLWRGALWGFQRPLEELRATRVLRDAEVPVPRPMFMAARRRWGPFWDVVVGTQHEEDALDGLAWLRTDPAPDDILRAARTVGRAVRSFHDAGGAHADLHLKNLLVAGRGDAMRAWVIDLDGARVGSPPAPDRRLQELMRIVRSLHKRGVSDQVGREGCDAGFEAYCGGDDDLRRALLRHLPRERRRVARHVWAYGRVPRTRGG